MRVSAWLIAGVVLSLAGCSVSRDMSITSNPAGAAVLIDGLERGTTPLSTTVKWSKDAKSASHAHEIVIRRGEFEAWRQEFSYPQAESENRRPWPVHADLERLVHRVELQVVSDPPGATVLIEGGEPFQTPAQIDAVFSRASAQQPWTSANMSARAVDHAPETRTLTYEDAIRNPNVLLVLDRTRQAIPLRITANEPGATVLVNGEPVGATPVEHVFVFEGSQRQDRWNSFAIRVEKDRFRCRLPAGQASPGDIRPCDRTVTVKEAITAAGRLEPFALEPVQYLRVPVHRHVVGRQGLALESQLTLSQVTDIEREPKAGSVTQITSAAEFRETRVSVMPDNQTIVFSQSYHLPHDADREYVNMWLQRGHELTRLTDGQQVDVDASVSADGKWIYFSSDRLRPGEPNIWRVPAIGRGGLTKITDSPSSLADVDPAPSPGGDRLAFTTYLKSGAPPQVWVSQADGSLPTQLRLGRQPSWSPDSARLAYVSPDAGGGDQVWIMNVDGSEPTQMTSGAGRHGHPCWTPDGQRIIYACDQAVNGEGVANMDIWIMNADGSGKTQLTVNGSYDTRPVVSPDGHHVYFVSNRGAVKEFEDATQIWRIDLSSD